MKIFEDIKYFFSLLTVVDVIFFIAIIVLLILLVTLIYFIRINEDGFDENDFFNYDDKNNKKDDIVNEIIEKVEIENKKQEDVKKENAEFFDDEEGELLDLKGLTAKLESMKNNEVDNTTEYEKEQESKAIISYEELLQKHNRYKINYDEVNTYDDLIIKKVNLEETTTNEDIPKSNVRVISYSHEEAFLNALKELNSLLN